MEIKNRHILFLIAFLVAIMLLQCNHSRTLKKELEVERERVQQEITNAKAKDQQIEIITNKNGDLVYQVTGYVLELGRLKQSEKDLLADYQDLLDMYEDLKDINAIIKADLDIAEKTLSETKALLINDTTLSITSNITDDFGAGNSRVVDYQTLIQIDDFGKKFTPLSSSFDIRQKIRLMAILDESDESPRLRITTNYPGVEITDIENINLINNRLAQESPEEPVDLNQAIGLGLNVGFGINHTGSGNFRLGPTIGVGFQMIPKKLRFK